MGALGAGDFWLPEDARDALVLGRERHDRQTAFEEAHDLPEVLHDGCESDDHVGEGVAVDCSFVGVGDVFVLTAFEVPVH